MLIQIASVRSERSDSASEPISKLISQDNSECESLEKIACISCHYYRLFNKLSLLHMNQVLVKKNCSFTKLLDYIEQDRIHIKGFRLVQTKILNQLCFKSNF